MKELLYPKPGYYWATWSHCEHGYTYGEGCPEKGDVACDMEPVVVRVNAPSLPGDIYVVDVPGSDEPQPFRPQKDGLDKTYVRIRDRVLPMGTNARLFKLARMCTEVIEE